MAGRYLRPLPNAAHHAVRELRRAPADRVRLPDMRSPSPDMKPQLTAGSDNDQTEPALAEALSAKTQRWLDPQEPFLIAACEDADR